MPRPDKIAKVEEIRERFQGNEAIFLTDFSGLKVDEINSLRFMMRDLGADYRVLKNTLTLLAIKDTEHEDLSKLVTGPVAAAFVSGDAMQVAKELIAFSKDNPALEIKGGFMEGKVLLPADVRSLAALPSRDVLLAKITGGLKAPIYSLYNVLSGPHRKLVYALQAVAQTKSEAA